MQNSKRNVSRKMTKNMSPHLHPSRHLAPPIFLPPCNLWVRHTDRHSPERRAINTHSWIRTSAWGGAAIAYVAGNELGGLPIPPNCATKQIPLHKSPRLLKSSDSRRSLDKMTCSSVKSSLQRHDSHNSLRPAFQPLGGRIQSDPRTRAGAFTSFKRSLQALSIWIPTSLEPTQNWWQKNGRFLHIAPRNALSPCTQLRSSVFRSKLGWMRNNTRKRPIKSSHVP